MTRARVCWICRIQAIGTFPWGSHLARAIQSPLRRSGMSGRLFALCFLVVASAYCQTLNTGTFFGTVKDASGATVPDTSVRIAREGTLFQRDTSTDGEGNYRLLEIPSEERRVGKECRSRWSP